MAKYLLLDIEKSKPSVDLISLIGWGCVLSEEETMDIFKDIWEAGSVNGQGFFLTAPNFDQYVKENL